MALNGLYCADVPLSNYSLTFAFCLTGLVVSAYRYIAITQLLIILVLSNISVNS